MTKVTVHTPTMRKKLTGMSESPTLNTPNYKEIYILYAAVHITSVRRCLEEPAGYCWGCCLPGDLRLGDMTQWAVAEGHFLCFFAGFFFLVLFFL